nr:hypothetical protein [uncultured Gemmiger sp.]
MSNQSAAKRNLASLAFLVFSVILLFALLTGRPVRRTRVVDLTCSTETAGWYEETEAGSGEWVYHNA